MNFHFCLYMLLSLTCDTHAGEQVFIHCIKTHFTFVAHLNVLYRPKYELLFTDANDCCNKQRMKFSHLEAEWRTSSQVLLFITECKQILRRGSKFKTAVTIRTEAPAFVLCEERMQTSSVLPFQILNVVRMRTNYRAFVLVLSDWYTDKEDIENLCQSHSRRHNIKCGPCLSRSAFYLHVHQLHIQNLLK